MVKDDQDVQEGWQQLCKLVEETIPGLIPEHGYPKLLTRVVVLPRIHPRFSNARPCSRTTAVRGKVNTIYGEVTTILCE